MTNTPNTNTPAAAPAEAPTFKKGHLAVVLPDGTVAYRRTENAYTHVVAGRNGEEWNAVSWHRSLPLAEAASLTPRHVAGYGVPGTVVPVYSGPWAEAPAKAAKAAKAPAAPTGDDTAPVVRSKSTVSKDGEMTCRVCGDTKPVTKFPTSKDKDGAVVRVDRCRECRDEAAAARKAAKA